MVGRVELKYLVGMELYDELKKRIEPFVVRDRPGYTVRSIYFDTPNLDYYNDKVEGLEIRKKVRIRVYDVKRDNSFAFLEIKRKHGLMIFKNRAVVFYSNLEKFLETGDINKYVLKTEPTSRESARKFLYNLFVYKLKPVILVTYDREAFHGKFNQEIRITFDSELRSLMNPKISDIYVDDVLKFASPNFFVLEIKYPHQDHGMPTWLRSVIYNYELNLVSFSKYVVCFDSHINLLQKLNF